MTPHHPDRRSFLASSLPLAALALSVFAAAPAAQAQGAAAFPQRAIRLVVPYPAGGGADGLARQVAAYMQDKLKQPVVIDNRPGANTITATDYAARQPADGYTLLYVASSFTINPSLYKLSYATETDFAPVAMVAKVPLIVIAKSGYPVTDTAGLVKAAKAKPGAISYATYGIGSPVHLAAELFQSMTGTQMLHVPYKGSAPALTDLLAGQVNLSFSSIEPALELIRGKKVQAIGVTTAKRIAALPDVPAIAETVPGFEAIGWNGIVAPKGTPPDIVAKLAGVVNEAVQTPEFAGRYAKQGVEAEVMTPEAMGSFIRSEVAKWASVVKRANVKVDGE